MSAENADTPFLARGGIAVRRVGVAEDDRPIDRLLTGQAELREIAAHGLIPVQPMELVDIA